MKERFDVKGMTCAACQAHVEKATKSVNGVIECNVNLLNNNMDVTYDESICKKEDIFTAVKNAGYEVVNKDVKNDVKEEKNHSLRYLIISFVLLILLMYFSMGHMMWDFWVPDFLDMKINPVGFALIQFLLVLPICIIYRKYFISGFNKLIKRNPNMDSLIALGASASIIYGIVALFIISYGVSTNNMDLVETYHMNLYYESAGMILTLVSLGKYFEELSKRKTTKELDNLISLAPKKGKILIDGIEKEIDVKDIKVDDVLVIRTGDQVPVDGIVIEGNCSIDEANITGESIPKYKSIDDFCYSSTTLTSGFIKLKATKVGDDTSINTIIHLVEEASNSKAPISKLADKISKYFVPIIILISLLTFTVNMIISRDFELSLRFAITVLVIACPCALGLATPVAIMVGTGKGASLGLIIKNAEILENTGKIKTIIFDKTGTLTNGKPVVTDYNINEELKDIIYSMEYKSSHPLAKAICEYLDGTILIDDIKVTNIDGRGLKAIYKNKDYYIGNDKILN
ncbi:MAG: HAD-IC family P-type ATPase, partial [Acholeplasmatales bacterium]|nr:HAD-IC family P-type ATPase [Acholeplasmatales bacterium]